ncbi:tyrosine--tRNA ligase [candidate division WWE3 bacterium RBG_19FT_COMBO_53_11]|uniref:Tyrosine--tRNA ligase n=1 Tax=candidate division WWE3 bacterium RBG_19FT_COMBO_53_11 TaxID=1802613 RepID=A0A1F4UJU8_UNCKA|nr:MAG: tyrosine--tRNA ligase [candidate division WWE3 bacterium RBG_16_52_45]OGC44493.1 MAG: tyrosine--tRNA ligase [candidate division WWE3 bacterium RBG_19FT_COMBO_53_11]
MNSLEELLSRGVEKIYPDREALEKILKQRKIRLYLGIDPTGGRLHLGHTVLLRKLQKFAELGHEAILLIGTGTVLVGDPSQRSGARERVDEGEIQRNISTWRKQAEKILDFSKVRIKQNGDWLLKLTMKDLIAIASNISAVQLFKRDMFQERLKRGDTVWAHETLYPLLQGYDSVALDVDLEIGGTDQTFNMLVGRELMQKMRGKEKYVLAVPMILGTDGKPMSKTSENCVWLEDEPSEMYGKLMSIPDEQTDSYLELVTDVPQAELDGARKLSPLDKKCLLALTVVKMYHGEEKAQQVQKEFKNVFSKGGIPEDIPTWKLSGRSVNLPEVLVDRGLVKSKSEARRLISQGGITLNDRKLMEPEVTLEKGVLKVGKRVFIRIE